MPQKTIQLSFFVSLTLCLFVLSFLVFKPYLGVVFLSGVLSVVFYPLHKRFVQYFSGRQSLASALTLCIIVVAIIIPAIFISTSVFKEAVGLYNSLTLGNGAERAILYSNTTLSKFAQSFFNDTSLNIEVENYFKDILDWVIGHFNSVFTVVFNGILGFILMLISVYYMLRNAVFIREHIIVWSPLPDRYDEEILSVLKGSIDAVISGRFVVSLIQGLLIGVGFFIFGVGSPVLWGFVGAIASLVPTIGTAIITVPAVIFLFANGNVGMAVGLLVWSAMIVGLIDNVLSVVILNRKTKVNPLIILFSILGGVEFFGAVGILAGPLLVSAFLSLMKIYPFIMSYRKENLS